MSEFFNINYEFDSEAVHARIAERLLMPGSDYICVADGVIMSTAHRDEDYRRIINDGMFSICDSGYVPMYIRWIHGKRFCQYSGSQIFRDIVSSRRYRMAFLGAQQHVLNGLRSTLTVLNPDIGTMLFHELPFLPVEEFDYPAIARMVEEDEAEIVWVALGAPKQEIFMSKLRPHLHHGVMIAVGAAFKFFSGTDVHRAPQWMVRNHLEFVHRLCHEPKKQIRRCYWIVRTLPKILHQEYKKR